MAINFQPNFLSSVYGPRTNAVFSGVGDDLGLTPAAVPNMPVQQIQAPQASRRSVLDIIGGLGDVFARAGGADAQYQPQLDARAERARQVDLDDMRRQQFEMQQRQGEQGLRKGDLEYRTGEIELDDAQRAKVGQASRGLAAVFSQGGAPAVQKAWPILARQLGIEPEKAEIFGQALAADTEGTLTALNAAMTPVQAQGSLPAQVQIVAMLDKRDPTGKLSQQYVENLASGMDANEAARISIQRDTLRDRTAYNNRRQSWAENPNNPRNRPKPVKGEKSPEEIAAGVQDFRDVLTGLRTNYDALRRDGAITTQGGRPASNIVARARASGVGQLAESYLGTNAQTYRDNISTSRPALVQAIAKATGMTAKQLDSNADMKLALSQATDPTQSYETNMAALARLERFISNRSGGNRSTPRARPSGKLSPRGGPSVSNW